LPALSALAARPASASTMKSTGTRFAGLRPQPTLMNSPGDGTRSIAESVK
jgi:hypothetical protein